MFTYTKAIVPEPGDPVSSAVFASQARALNDRLRLGPSVPWRIVWHLFQAFKQVRNPDASGYLFPTQAEFFEFYQLLEEHADWPLTGPGDPEGANLASPWPAWVFGNGTARVDSEEARISDEAAGGIEMNVGGGTPEELWTLAKRQRGAVDGTTGAIGAPALRAAASHAYLRQNPASPSAASSYGDYLPGPEYLGQCDSPNELTSSYTIQFTKLDGSATVLTFGTCPENPGDVAGIVNTPFEAIVYKYDGSFEVLPKKTWLEGPYTSNPSLRKTESGFYDRAINAFVREFRGTEDQRATGAWGEGSFLTHEVLTTQYHLAPQRGSTSGAYVVAKYPRWERTGIAGRVAAGTMLPLVIGAVGNWYSVHAGFTCASAFLRVKKLVGSVTVEMLRDGDVIASMEIVADENGAASAIVTLDRPPEGGKIAFRLASAGTWKPGGEIRTEITELMTYQPSLVDLYLILRCGGVNFGDAVDGSGVQCEFSREISEDYLSSGVIRSHLGHAALPGSLAAINSNAVFDAARRLSQCVRIMPAEQLRGYAVVGGKSVLWFDRYARGMSHSIPIDLFAGIAPAREQIASGMILWGRSYVVRGTAGQRVSYAGRLYGVGQRFTGRKDVPEFGGDGQVWEAEGIRSTPEPQGWTNQWLFGVNLEPYKETAESQWKPDAFSRYYPLIDRCIFGDQAAAADKVIARHMAYGNRIVSPYAILTPEAPESFRYAPTPLAGPAGTRINSALCDEGDTACETSRRGFYESCRLFEPWPEVESCVMDGDLVKVTLKGRMHSHPDAPASIDRDLAGWDISALRSEGWRTLENGIREKLWYDATGTNGSIKDGDQAFNSLLGSAPDHPWGSIWPHFTLVKLVPEPWTDGNADGDDADTPMVTDVMPMQELYIRAACEGFVDGHTSAENMCATGATDLYGFSFENLCYRAFGGRWFSTVGSAPSEFIGTEETRPDKPQGFGYLQQTYPFAEVAAQMSKAINLLTRFRVMIPATLQMRIGTGSMDVVGVPTKNGANLPAGAGSWMAESGSGSDFAIVYYGALGAPAISSWSTWTDSNSEIVTTSASLDRVSGQAVLTLSASQIQYRWEAIGDAIYALPPVFRDMLGGSPMVVAAVDRTLTVFQQVRVVGAFAGRQCHPVGGSPDAAWGDGNGGSNAFISTDVISETVCRIVEGGTLSPEALPPGLVASVDSVSDPNPANRCQDGPSSTVGLAVVATTTPAISVPLVEFVETLRLPPQ